MSVNIKTSKLSRMQKAIIEYLYNHYKEPGFTAGGYWCTVSTLSWFVAHRFNRGHNDRVWDAKLATVKIMEDTKERLKGLTDAEGNFKDDKAREKGEKLHEAALLTFKIIDGAHRQAQLLTPKHRASFSRSLRRLEERGLVKCCVDFKIREESDRWVWVWYKGSGRTRYVELTEEGVQLCKRIISRR